MLVLLYVWRSLLARIRANAITMLAVVLFVVGSSLGLSFYFSLRAMLHDSSPPENIIVISKGAASEAGSRLPLETARKIPLVDGVKKVGDAPLAARETVTRLQLATGAAFEDPVTIRGIDELSPQVHHITMVEGVLPDSKSLGILLGKRVASSHPELAIGTELHLPAGASPITGIFSAEGGPHEDEVWTPRPALELHVKTKVSSSVTFAATDVGRVSEIVDKINDSKDLNAQAAPISDFLEKDAGFETIARTVLVLLVLLSVVATSAIATTMNAAAVARMPELAALAAIGIRRSFLARLVMFESTLLSVLGALLGVALSAIISQKLGVISLGANPVDVSGSVSVPLIGVGLGLVVGLVGGVFPALMVRRLDIMQAIR